MGFFSNNKQRTKEEIAEQTSYLESEEELEKKEYHIEEIRAAKRELKRRYGHDFMRVIGGMDGVRSFLSGANRGLRSEANKVSGSSANTGPIRRL